MLIRVLTVLSFLAIAPTSLLAQGKSGEKIDLTAKLKPDPARAGEAVTLELAVTVAPGWHVYGGTNSQVPTTLVLTDTGGLTAEGAAFVPEGHRKQVTDSFANWEIEGSFTITQRLRVPAGRAPGPVTVRGHVHLMACDEN